MNIPHADLLREVEELRITLAKRETELKRERASNRNLRKMLRIQADEPQNIPTNAPDLHNQH